MGDSVEAHLVYGYVLGGPDEGAHLHEETPDWMHGYPQDYLDGLFARAGRPRHLVKMISNGQWESKGYVLAATASIQHADEGYAKALQIPQVRAAWDLALQEALELLKITPIQPEPQWVLSSYYG